MNKLFKITVVAAVTFTAAGAFAAPHRPHHEKNEGIRLATDIIKLVDCSIRLLTGTPQTVVVTQPAVVTPAITTPVVVAPQPPVIINHTTTHRPIIIKQQNHRKPPRVVHHKPAPPRKPARRR